MAPVHRDTSRINRTAPAPPEPIQHDDSSPYGFLDSGRRKPERDVNAGGRTRPVRREIVPGGGSPSPPECRLFARGPVAANDDGPGVRLSEIIFSR